MSIHKLDLAHKRLFDEDLVRALHPLPLSAVSKSEEIVQPYGNTAKKWVWSFNASDHNVTRPPSGFIFEVDKLAPVRPDVFAPEKFFSGVIAFQLPNGLQTISGELFGESYIERNHELLQRQLNEMVNEKANKPLSFENAENWEACLGGGGSYAGLFSSETRQAHHFEKNHWIVVSAGVPTISKEIYSMIEDLSYDSEKSVGVPAESTWQGFFLRNGKVNKAFNSSKLLRRRLAANVAAALNIAETSPIWTPDNSPGQRILEPHFETITNMVGETKRSLIFYDKTVNFETQNAVIYNDNPFVGPMILKKDQYYNSTELTKKVMSAFPVCSGRSGVLTNQQPDNKSNLLQSNGVFVWENQHNTPYNRRLTPGLYKASTGFNRKMKEIGIQFDVTELKPRLVKICNSES